MQQAQFLARSKYFTHVSNLGPNRSLEFVEGQGGKPKLWQDATCGVRALFEGKPGNGTVSCV